MNWKMTAKTILVQMHHKIQTFEHVHKKLVLIIQDKLLAYMTREFNFAHLKNPALIGDSMHLHAYRLEKQPDKSFKLTMQSRLSTDVEGIGTRLGLQAEARVELEQIVQALQEKLSPSTLFVPVQICYRGRTLRSRSCSNRWSTRPQARKHRRRSILTRPTPSCQNSSFPVWGTLRIFLRRERSWAPVSATA